MNKKRHLTLCKCATICFLLSFVFAAGAETLFWSSNQGIGKADLINGDNEVFIPTALMSPEVVAVDPNTGYIYWTDSTVGAVQRVAPERGVPETVIAGLENPAGVVVAAAEQKIYWAARVEDDSVAIQKANLDGTEIEDVLTGLAACSVFDTGCTEDIAIDENSGKIYWSGDGGIRRANLDGSEIEELVSADSVGSFDVDPIGEKLYWTSGSAVLWANLDGTDQEIIVEQIRAELSGIAVDPIGERIYWLSNFGRGEVHRATLDGGISRIIADDQPRPSSIAVDPERGRVVWLSNERDRNWTVVTSNVDGTELTDVLESFAEEVFGVAVDEISGDVFWTQQRGGVFSTGPDADVVEAIGTGRFDLGIEVTDNWVYWSGNTDRTGDTGTISRMNRLDGTTEETIVEEIGNPVDLAVDEISEKIYWIANSEGTIRRADPDGSNIEPVVLELSSPRGIDIDEGAGLIYWSNGRTIQRSDLNGGNIETIAANIEVRGIALDTTMGKIYWTAPSAGTVWRSNLDGTDVEEVISGLENPRYLDVID